MGKESLGRPLKTDHKLNLPPSQRTAIRMPAMAATMAKSPASKARKSRSSLAW